MSNNERPRYVGTFLIETANGTELLICGAGPMGEEIIGARKLKNRGDQAQPAEPSSSGAAA